MLTPGMSRARAADAAAVIELVRRRCECAALLGWAAGAFAVVEEESDDARMTGSKCSFSRSNSSESGAESSNFCSCAEELLRNQKTFVHDARTGETSGLLERDTHFR